MAEKNSERMRPLKSHPIILSHLTFKGINNILKNWSLKSGNLYRHTHTTTWKPKGLPTPAELLLINHEIQPRVQFSAFKRDIAPEINFIIKHCEGKHMEKSPPALWRFLCSLSWTTKEQHCFLPIIHSCNDLKKSQGCSWDAANFTAKTQLQLK